MSRRNVRRLTLWLILGLVILGCASPVLVTPPPVSAPDSVETVIIQTAAAAQTQTVAALPSPTNTFTATSLPRNTATNTSTPTATIIFVTDTGTPPPILLTNDPDDGGGNNGGGNGNGYVKPTATPREWACRVLYRYPDKGTVILGGSSFKATWTVQNTGTKSWPKKGVDVVFSSGAYLHTGKPYYDIPAAIGTGGTVTISVTMTVPKRSKTYQTRWSLRVGKTEFCGVQIVVEVK